MQKQISVWRVAAMGAVAALSLSACSPYVGVGIPVGPFSVGVGVGSGGVSAGVGTGVGPVGVGVGVNQSGQVTGNAGVGVGTSVGGANVGVGVGTGTVLYDPAASSPDGGRSPEPSVPEAGRVVPGAQPSQAAPVGAEGGALQWRGADGQTVPDCKFRSVC
ncbi:hypothetical protein [Comamonas odontotermitis]|uniref:hypothetical protein n=1 Tax=Comamonas odontotermitis TaxID=379895 RepID=UPI00366E36EE